MGIEEILGVGGPVPEKPPYPVPPGVDVHPGLMPAQWFVDQAQVGPHLAVMLCIAQPSGLSYSFWPDDTAVRIGQELVRLGNLTKAGLHLPPMNGRMPKPKDEGHDHSHPHPPQQ